MTTANYADIGALLKRAREEMKLTLPQAAQGLHIRTHYLQALEQGKLSELPGKAYAKGYLQSYASFLNLDKNEIVRRYEQVESALPEHGFYFPHVFSKEKKPTREMMWGGALATFFVYIIWALIFAPHASNVPLVEPLPEKKTVIIPVLTTPMQDLPCISDAEPLYPACFRAAAYAQEDFSFLPLHRKMQSIMDITQR